MPPNEKARVINEVRLLDRLEHENIIDFHGSWVNRERGEVCFITEILSSGSLKKFINKVQVVRWKIIKRWVRQILKALAYLHSQTPPIIHRDIKCENIFINGSTGDLRIGDLGLSTAKKVNEGKGQSVLGTPEFMAPELYDEEYDEKVDVFAFGMCVLEMITKQLPYSECTNATQIYRKVCGNVPPDALRLIPDDKALDFVKGCIQKDPAERLGAAELLKHDFLVPDPNFGETEVRLRSPSDLPPIADRQAGRSQGAASVETRDSGGAGSTVGSEWSPPKAGEAEAFPAEPAPAAPAPAEGEPAAAPAEPAPAPAEPAPAPAAPAPAPAAGEAASPPAASSPSTTDAESGVSGLTRNANSASVDTIDDARLDGWPLRTADSTNSLASCDLSPRTPGAGSGATSKAPSPAPSGRSAGSPTDDDESFINNMQQSEFAMKDHKVRVREGRQKRSNTEEDGVGWAGEGRAAAAEPARPRPRDASQESARSASSQPRTAAPPSRRPSSESLPAAPGAADGENHDRDAGDAEVMGPPPPRAPSQQRLNGAAPPSRSPPAPRRDFADSASDASRPPTPQQAAPPPRAADGLRPPTPVQQPREPSRSPVPSRAASRASSPRHGAADGPDAPDAPVDASPAAALAALVDEQRPPAALADLAEPRPAAAAAEAPARQATPPPPPPAARFRMLPSTVPLGPVVDGVVTVDIRYAYDGIEHSVDFEYDISEEPSDVAVEFAGECGYGAGEVQPFAEFLQTVRGAVRLRREKAAAAAAPAAAAAAAAEPAAAPAPAAEPPAAAEPAGDGAPEADASDDDSEDEDARAKLVQEHAKLRNRAQHIHEDRMLKLHASRDACETSAKLVREEFEKKQRDFEKLQREHDRKRKELEAAREDARVHHERQLKKFDKDLRDFAHKEKIEHENHAKRLVTLDDQHRTEADEQRRQRREGRRAGLAEEETARRIAREAEADAEVETERHRAARAAALALAAAGTGMDRPLEALDGLAAPLPARGANPQAT